MREIENNLTTIVLNDIEYSAINIGPESSGVPKHILQTERQSGIIIDGEEISSFEWKGVTKDSEYQYVYFDKLELEPLEAITTTSRKNALYLIKEIAYGIINASPSFLDMATGIFPLYRIYILDKTKILLLPPDMGALISISRIGERSSDYLTKRNTEKGFTLIREMAELMYWAATGRLPYENKDVRTCDYTEVPLSWYESNLDKKCLGFIESVLHMRERQMRDISGNRKAQVNLSWFLKESVELDWNLDDRTVEEREESVSRTEGTEEYTHYFAKIEKEAKKRNFWRVKGTLILSVAAVAVIICVILGSVLKAKYEAPYTRDMDKNQIVADFFNNMNNIDPTAMDNNAFKATAPQYNAVLGLYVNKQTRTAYETLNPAVNLQEWLRNGKPAIPATSFIYGADITSITELDDNTLRASGTWYTPYRESEELDIEPPEGYTVVYTYDVDEDFTFEWSKRGWWIVTNIEITKYEYTGYELIETYTTPSTIERMLGTSGEKSV